MSKFVYIHGTASFVPTKKHGDKPKTREEQAARVLLGFCGPDGRIPASRLGEACMAASLATTRHWCPARTKRLAELLRLAPLPDYRRK